jgi:multiple sugar transport system substrate-binding protein
MASALILTPPVRAEEEITLWSHWADHVTKVDFVETAVKNFEQKNPGAKVKITWYQKKPLYSALKVALSAGKAPDIFYTEVDQTEYIDNNFLLPLDDLLNWENIEPWARESWMFNGKTYGFPLETQTIELYYNKDLLAKLGFKLPANGQFSQAEFTELVKKASAADITPLAQGVGDRPYPGHYMTYQTLLKKLGKQDYGRLLAGKLSYKDPRVIETLNWVKSLIDAGLYPKSFATVKLGESHGYFYLKPGAVMIAMGSWYTTRAFNPPEKGGQPEDFPLGIMQFPAPDGAACPNCKTAAVGGSYSINAATKYPKLAAGLLNEMATPEMGTKWLTEVLVQGGVKGDPTKITGKYTAYFEELVARNQGTEVFIGLPHQLAQGQCQDALVQVMNVAFPAGLISVEDAAAQMDTACYNP